MCFRPPTVETRKVCQECGFENVAEGIDGLTNCQQCGAELPLSEMEKLQMQISGGVPSAPGVPGAPSAPKAPSTPGVPKAPAVPKAPSAPAAPQR